MGEWLDSHALLLLCLSMIGNAGLLLLWWATRGELKDSRHKEGCFHTWWNDEQAKVRKLEFDLEKAFEAARNLGDQAKSFSSDLTKLRREKELAVQELAIVKAELERKTRTQFKKKS